MPATEQPLNQNKKLQKLNTAEASDVAMAD